MSTNSTITIKNADGTVDGVYCHWDGYLEHNGRILLEHYKTEDKIRKLVSLGDMSILAKDIEPSTEQEHTFNKPQRGVCVFYHRDRGEDWETVKPSLNMDYKLFYRNKWQEYNYIFKDGEWFYRKNQSHRWFLLKNAKFD